VTKTLVARQARLVTGGLFFGLLAAYCFFQLATAVHDGVLAPRGYGFHGLLGFVLASGLAYGASLRYVPAGAFEAGPAAQATLLLSLGLASVLLLWFPLDGREDLRRVLLLVIVATVTCLAVLVLVRPRASPRLASPASQPTVAGRAFSAAKSPAKVSVVCGRCGLAGRISPGPSPACPTCGASTWRLIHPGRGPVSGVATEGTREAALVERRAVTCAQCGLQGRGPPGSRITCPRCRTPLVVPA
jgi:hypothetical protein